MKRRLLLGGLALAAAAPAAAAAARVRPASAPALEVLTTHLANPERISPAPQPGQLLRLRRDHQRSFDPAAVAVETASGQHLGYVPPVQAGVLSRLLDRGASGHAQLTPDGRLRVFLDT